MNESFSCKTIDDIFEQIGEFIRQQREEQERTLAEIITKYDFIVGSKECKYKLMKVLPEGANIICSPYFDSPTIIYAIKKFNITDFINSPCEDVCEWFEQYVDIATDIVELRFSDGTVKRAKRGLYMRDIEKSIRKMLIDQISKEPKTDTLDKIRAEIEDIYCGQYCENPLTADAVREMALEIIDKYKVESEVNNGGTT